MDLTSAAGSQLTWNEALSGIFGSVSLACWIFLLVPQLIENYRQGSADGISLLFISIWFLGDIANLAGATWARLVPTVIALAVYFCFADCALIGQCVYYNFVKRRREEKRRSTVGSAGSDTEPLLRRSSTNDSNLGRPGSRRRRSSAQSRRLHATEHRESLSSILEEGGGKGAWLRNTVSVFLIIAAGAGGWAAAWRSGAWKPAPISDPDDDGGAPIGAEVLGYISAVAYLGARIPQIIKNQRERSCEGLSLLFFLLSMMGNLTYGAGILFHSIEKKYVITNLPWLIGSLGTIAEDTIIFAQFHMFKNSAIAEGEY